jgi:hypothetical protein
MGMAAALPDQKRRDAALRRVRNNPELQPIMNRLVEISQMEKPARNKAIAALGKEYPGFIAMGANNFYSVEDIVELKATISFTLSSAN